jgi:hypothetical protein
LAWRSRVFPESYYIVAARSSKLRKREGVQREVVLGVCASLPSRPVVRLWRRETLRLHLSAELLIKVGRLRGGGEFPPKTPGSELANRAQRACEIWGVMPSHGAPPKPATISAC